MIIVLSKGDIKTRVTLKCLDDVERRLKAGILKPIIMLNVDYYIDIINEMYAYWYELTPSKKTISEILKRIKQYVDEY